MVYGDSDMVDEHGELINPCPTMPFDLKPLVCGRWFIPQQSTFIRRAVLDRVAEVNEDLHLVMDWELYLRMAMAGTQIRYLEGRLANFRTYPEAKTNAQFMISGQEKLAVLDEVAYVRFASVYRQFRDVNQFMKELKVILQKEKTATKRK